MKKKNKQDGFVLIIVLVIIAVLAVFVLEYHYSMKVNQDVISMHRERARALHAAKAGFNIAMALLENEENMDYPEEEFFKERDALEIDGTTVKFRIKDENGKININLLADKDASGQIGRQRTEQLLELCDILDMEYGIVPAIVDWTDEDDDVTVLEYVAKDNMGAEEDYYQSLENPYQIKNAPFDTLKELSLVRGITDEILFGYDDEGKKVRTPLIELLTIYGDGKININTASTEVLQSLDSEISESVAEYIIEVREEELFEDISELKSSAGLEEAIYARISSSICVGNESSFFSIKTEGACGNSRRKISAIVEKDEEDAKIKKIHYWEQS